MNERQLDNTNDVSTYEITSDGTVKKRVCRITSFSERTMQLVRTALSTFQGECFVDYDAGIPWFDDVLGNSTLFADEISSEIKDSIEALEGVDEVVDIVVTIEGRNVAGKFKIRLEDGSIETGDF